MTRFRMASAAAALLLVGAALLGPAASAQTPSPSPSPSGSGAASPSASASGAPAREGVALLLSAEPAAIDAGDETVLVAQVTNTGTGTTDATLEVVLPDELEFVSSFPAPASRTGDAVTFTLPSLDAGESAVVQITARGVTVVDDALVSAIARAGGATADDSASVSVVEAGADGALAVSSRTRGVLTAVGSMVRYEVTVSNVGGEDLANVLVVDVAPEEIEVVSVDLIDAVEAVQIGESGGRHDIVWNVGSLPAGASIQLPWDGRAARAGDLKAVNSVRGLVGTTETTRSRSESFLAAEGPRDVDNPPFEPIEKRVVTFEDPESTVAGDEHAATQPGAVLPFTGSSPRRVIVAGLMLMLGGVLLVAGTRLAGNESRKALGAALLAGLVFGACVSNGDDPATEEAAAPRASEAFATDDPLTEADESPRVKGERIVRETPAPETPAPATDAPEATPAPTAPPTLPPTATPPPVIAAPETAPPADTEPVRVVTVVRTGLEDLPIETQGSRDGDNTISFGWDESTGGITYATSGTRFVDDAGSDLLTDLSSEGGVIVNRMSLRNTAEDTRLQVRGRLVHEVYDGARLVARLRSEPIDVVLSPGGDVTATFSYLLPAGDYRVESSFENSQ